MTWVIGAASPFGGYGLMVSDIQVTLANGERVDILTKVHPVSRQLVMGFSGSVQIGFAMVDRFREVLQIPPDAPHNAIWIPQVAAELCRAPAAEVFAASAPEERMLGCSLLLVAIHPTENNGIPSARAYVIRMADPDFRLGYSPRRLISVLSIGSGRKVPAYRKGIRELVRNRSLLKAEWPNTGGWGEIISFALSILIENHMEPGISRHLHIADVRRHGILIYNNNRTMHPQNGDPIEVRMPATASNYQEFRNMLNRRAVVAEAASC